MIRISVGSVGCVAKGTMINVNRGGNGRTYDIYRMWYMFRRNDPVKGWDLSIPTMVRSFDGGRIRLHKVHDVVQSGRKLCWKLTLSDGSYLIATPEHRIMTRRGFIPLSQLDSADEVMVDTLKPRRGKRRSYRLRSPKIHAGHHPYKVQGRVSAHRLTYEAHINDLSFIDYMDILWNDARAAAGLTYIDPSEYDIHHIDGNRYNNDIDNLTLKTRRDHAYTHAAEHFRNFNQGTPIYTNIISAEPYQECMTYDIICEDPYHNFVANGIVVHNSGKSAAEVRNMVKNPEGRDYYTNLHTTLPYQHDIDPTMILKREQVDTKTNKKTGEERPVYDYKVNHEFWKDKGDINVVLDEAHTLLNSRRSMSKVNILMTDWLALIRRVLGGGGTGEGELVLITQLWNRLDNISRDMANQVKFHICHYKKTCMRCANAWTESSDTPEPLWYCPRCAATPENIMKHGHIIEIYAFQGMQAFLGWKDFGMKTYYKHYYITDIEDYFGFYDTYQWDNMFTEVL